MALSELSEDYEVAGKLTLAEGELNDHLRTSTKSLDNKEVWVNADTPGWAYILMDNDCLYTCIRLLYFRVGGFVYAWNKGSEGEKAGGAAYNK